MEEPPQRPIYGYGFHRALQTFFISFLTDEIPEEAELWHFTFAYIVLRLNESGTSWGDAVEMTQAFFDNGEKYGLPDGFSFDDRRIGLIYEANHEKS